VVALDCAHLAGLSPATAYSYLVADTAPGDLLDDGEAQIFAEQNGLSSTTVERVIAYADREANQLDLVVQRHITTTAGPFTMSIYRRTNDPRSVLACVTLTSDQPTSTPGDALVIRVTTSEQLLRAAIDPHQVDSVHAALQSFAASRRGGSVIVVIDAPDTSALCASVISRL
jgi:hypothetical protein